jgi:hypothetical protein
MTKKKGPQITRIDEKKFRQKKIICVNSRDSRADLFFIRVHSWLRNAGVPGSIESDKDSFSLPRKNVWWFSFSRRSCSVWAQSVTAMLIRRLLRRRQNQPRKLRRLKLVHDLLDRFFCIPENHARVFLVKKRVFDAGKTRGHRAFEHKNSARFIDIDDRHAVNRA